jgi:hypothetical protein
MLKKFETREKKPICSLHSFHIIRAETSPGPFTHHVAFQFYNDGMDTFIPNNNTHAKRAMYPKIQ